LTANFNDQANNQGKLVEAEAFAQTSKAKLKLDSSLFVRQKALWNQQVGTRVAYEQAELNFDSMKEIIAKKEQSNINFMQQKHKENKDENKLPNKTFAL
jgi:hypothetical protein